MTNVRVVEKPGGRNLVAEAGVGLWRRDLAANMFGHFHFVGNVLPA